MKRKELIICAVFIAGAAVLYDTKDVCTSVASQMAGADVREIVSFNDLK